MPLIAGLDIAKGCGIAFVDAAKPCASWRCMTMESSGETPWDTVDDFDEGLRDLLKRFQPDFAVIERPLGVVVDYGAGQAADTDRRMINATTTITLAGLAGNAIGVLNGLGVPYGMISDRTWRKVYFGSGFEPPIKIVKQRGKEKIEKDWKAAAVAMAKRQGIILPDTKAAAHNAAEAVGLAVAWKAVNWIPRRHQPAFLALRTGAHHQPRLFKETA